MKEKINKIIKISVIIIYYLLIAFLLFFSVGNMIIDFDIPQKMKIILTFISVPFCLSLCGFVCVMRIMQKPRNKKAKIIKNNINQIELGIYLLIALFISHRYLPKDIDEIKNSITFLWTIIGINIATFIFVHVKYLDIIEKKSPSLPDKISIASYKKYIEDKEQSYSLIKNMVNSTFALIIGAAFSTLCTINVYLNAFSIKILGIFCNLLLVINILTLLSLILDTTSLFLANVQRIRVEQSEIEAKEIIDDFYTAKTSLIEIIENSTLEKEIKSSLKEEINKIFENKINEEITLK